MSEIARVSFDDMATGVRFLTRLPSFLRNTMDLAEARALVASRLEHRAENFIETLRLIFSQRPDSPYAELLRHAGCEAGDVDQLVRSVGVEGALHALYRVGVYLTIDEFKGRRPAVRGTATVNVSPDRLRNPRSALRH